MTLIDILAGRGLMQSLASGLLDQGCGPSPASLPPASPLQPDLPSCQSGFSNPKPQSHQFMAFRPPLVPVGQSPNILVGI